MLRHVKDTRGHPIRTAHRESVDLYFNDLEKATCHLVTDEGSSVAASAAVLLGRAIGPTHMSEPVSWQQEAEYFGYAGHPYYWEGKGLSDAEVRPSKPAERIRMRPETATRHACHLRGCKAGDIWGSEGVTMLKTSVAESVRLASGSRPRSCANDRGGATRDPATTRYTMCFNGRPPWDRARA